MGECEFTNDFINTKNMINKNILCLKDGKYCYYNTNNLTYHYFDDKKLSLCIDNIKFLSDLYILNDKYKNNSILNTHCSNIISLSPILILF